MQSVLIEITGPTNTVISLTQLLNHNIRYPLKFVKLGLRKICLGINQF